MENFIVSARKYRPDSFETVVAQASITNTLKNAIKSKQLAHAYLFCGPRGVGKTTCARIFAKTINCTNLSEKTEACNVCDSCKAFNTSRSFNIHELDAASNNSVDDIRNLTDQVRIPPQMGKYSVYIIDEVHMLSSQAFNAFLKTLEEPPKHAIFILATTEKHKIIPTILSRCQIFDFNRIKVEDISNHLAYVAGLEEVEVETDGLNIIAQKADGAMRDALSIFDQIVSFSGKKVTYHDVITNLNVLDYEYYFKLVDLFLKNDVPAALLVLNEILNNGFDGNHFIAGLSSHLRDLLVCKDPVTVQLLEVGGDIKERYKVQAAACPADFILEGLQISNDCDLKYKSSQNKRLLIELSLIRIAQLTLKKKIADENKNNKLAPVFSEAPETSPVASSTIPQPPIKKPEKEVKKIVLRKRKEDDAPLIKDALAGKFKEDIITAKEQHEVYFKPADNDDFTEEQLKQKWTEFLNRLHKKPNLKATLSKFPQVENKVNLILEIDNSVQEDSIAKVRPELVSWLRVGLKNSNIQLVTKIVENIQEKKAYSDDERYAELLKKNPDLAILKQKFRLDF